MELKKLFLPLIVLLMMGFVSAPTTTTITTPTANELFTPNMGDDYIDINFTVVDSTAANSIHILDITFATADGNISVAADVNLGLTNCGMADGDDWTSPGNTCFVRYTIPARAGSLIATGTYVLDVNVGSFAETVPETTGEAVQVFRIDNRYITTAVEAMINLAPVLLIAAVIVAVVLAMAGIISTKVALMASIGAAIAVVTVIVLATIMEILTP